MSELGKFSPDARELAHKLVKEQRLTLRQLQQGVEWSSRNGESLLAFLNRFCSLELSPEQLSAVDTEEGERRRRLFERHQSNSTLWIEVHEKLVEVSTLNISRGGLAFRCRWALEIGATVILGTEHKVTAIVRYCVEDAPETTTIGAEFEPRTIDDLHAIESLMSSLTTRVVGAE